MSWKLCFFIFLVFNWTLNAQVAIKKLDDDLFPVSIIHWNDFHARFEEINTLSNSCRPDEDVCIGGYARIVTMVKELQQNRVNAIYLNAGDNFQGTLWYNIGRYNVTAEFLNMLSADAMTIGNHEFDHNVDGVVPFMQLINSPILLCNIDDSLEPTFQGLYQKSIIIDKYDRKIGIIGVILSTTNLLANTGDLKFLDESESVKAEAEKLKAEGVDIIIVLSHCGLDVDYVIAKNAGPNVDVIVGGHSHTFMWTGENSPGPDTPQDSYPAKVVQDDGHVVLIVQASAYTKYLGDITVYFDSAGEVQNWEGQPIYMEHDIPQDQEVMEALKPWREVVDEVGLQHVGETRVYLQKSGCNYEECNIGNLVTDSFVNHYVSDAEEGYWTYAAISMTNVGGIRTSLEQGDLTFGDLVTVLPFGNTIDTLELRGKHLIETLEYAVSKSYDEDRFNGAYMLQMSGLRVVYNVTNPVGNRVVSAQALCNKCDVPEYSPINDDEYYRMIIPSFLAGGGDGFSAISDNKINHKISEFQDIDAFEAHVRRISPARTSVMGRITVLT